MKRKWCKFCLCGHHVPHNKVSCRSCGKRSGWLDVRPDRINTADLKREAVTRPSTARVVEVSVAVVVPGREGKPEPDRLALFNAGERVRLVHRKPATVRKLHRDQKAMRKISSRPYGRLLLNWILWRKPKATVRDFAEGFGSKPITVTGWIKTGKCGQKHAHRLMDMMVSDGTLPALLNKETEARWRVYQEKTCLDPTKVSRSSTGSSGYGTKGTIG